MRRYSRKAKRRFLEVEVALFWEEVAEYESSSSFPFSSSRPMTAGMEFWDPEAYFLYCYFDGDYSLQEIAESLEED